MASVTSRTFRTLQMAVYTDCDVNIQGYSSNVIAGDQIIHTYGSKPGASRVTLNLEALKLEALNCSA